MIKIYTQHLYLKTEKISRFFPLLDEMIFHKESIVHQSYCFVENSDDCDVLVLPLSIDYLLETKEQSIIHYFKNESKRLNKPLWVFAGGDEPLSLVESNLFVFKVVDFKSKKDKNTIVMPVFIKDPYQHIFNIQIDYLAKTAQPIVGYVGHAKGGFIKYLKYIIVFFKHNFDIFTRKYYSNYADFFPSSHKRIKILNILKSSQLVATNFIFRDKYRAGAKSVEDRYRTTLEFFENIRQSHYTFCMRGGGNFSVRLYETLAMGRIPIQIDTDCSLPLDTIIDWKEHCVFVPYNEAVNIVPMLLDFHSQYNEENFINLQKKNRIFWEDFLTRDRYFSVIHDLFIINEL